MLQFSKVLKLSLLTLFSLAPFVYTALPLEPAFKNNIISDSAIADKDVATEYGKVFTLALTDFQFTHLSAPTDTQAVVITALSAALHTHIKNSVKLSPEQKMDLLSTKRMARAIAAQLKECVEINKAVSDYETAVKALIGSTVSGSTPTPVTAANDIIAKINVLIAKFGLTAPVLDKWTQKKTWAGKIVTEFPKIAGETNSIIKEDLKYLVAYLVNKIVKDTLKDLEEICKPKKAHSGTVTIALPTTKDIEGDLHELERDYLAIQNEIVSRVNSTNDLAEVKLGYTAVTPLWTKDTTFKGSYKAEVTKLDTFVNSGAFKTIEGLIATPSTKTAQDVRTEVRNLLIASEALFEAIYKSSATIGQLDRPKEKAEQVADESIINISIFYNQIIGAFATEGIVLTANTTLDLGANHSDAKVGKVKNAAIQIEKYFSSPTVVNKVTLDNLGPLSTVPTIAALKPKAVAMRDSVAAYLTADADKRNEYLRTVRDFLDNLNSAFEKDIGDKFTFKKEMPVVKDRKYEVDADFKIFVDAYNKVVAALDSFTAPVSANTDEPWVTLKREINALETTFGPPKAYIGTLLATNMGKLNAAFNSVPGSPNIKELATTYDGACTTPASFYTFKSGGLASLATILKLWTNLYIDASGTPGASALIGPMPTTGDYSVSTPESLPATAQRLFVTTWNEFITLLDASIDNNTTTTNKTKLQEKVDSLDSLVANANRYYSTIPAAVTALGKLNGSLKAIDDGVKALLTDPDMTKIYTLKEKVSTIENDLCASFKEGGVTFTCIDAIKQKKDLETLLKEAYGPFVGPLKSIDGIISPLVKDSVATSGAIDAHANTLTSLLTSSNLLDFLNGIPDYVAAVQKVKDLKLKFPAVKTTYEEFVAAKGDKDKFANMKNAFVDFVEAFKGAWEEVFKVKKIGTFSIKSADVINITSAKVVSSNDSNAPQIQSIYTANFNIFQELVTTTNDLKTKPKDTEKLKFTNILQKLYTEKPKITLPAFTPATQDELNAVMFEESTGAVQTLLTALEAFFTSEDVQVFRTAVDNFITGAENAWKVIAGKHVGKITQTPFVKTTAYTKSPETTDKDKYEPIANAFMAISKYLLEENRTTGQLITLSDVLSSHLEAAVISTKSVQGLAAEKANIKSEIDLFKVMEISTLDKLTIAITKANEIRTKLEVFCKKLFADGNIPNDLVKMVAIVKTQPNDISKTETDEEKAIKVYKALVVNFNTFLDSVSKFDDKTTNDQIKAASDLLAGLRYKIYPFPADKGHGSKTKIEALSIEPVSTALEAFRKSQSEPNLTSLKNALVKFVNEFNEAWKGFQKQDLSISEEKVTIAILPEGFTIKKTDETPKPVETPKNEKNRNVEKTEEEIKTQMKLVDDEIDAIANEIDGLTLTTDLKSIFDKIAKLRTLLNIENFDQANEEDRSRILEKLVAMENQVKIYEKEEKTQAALDKLKRFVKTWKAEIKNETNRMREKMVNNSKYFMVILFCSIGGGFLVILVIGGVIYVKRSKNAKVDVEKAMSSESFDK